MQTSFVTQQVVVLAILMAIGYIATKKNIINDTISKGMTQILTAIALPSLIISSFNMSYSDDTLKGVLLIFAYSVGIHFLTILIAKLFFIKYPKDKNAVLRFGAIFPNSGFMGLPLIFDLFGQEAVLYASVFMIPYHTLLWTYGEGILSKGRTESPIRKLVTTPALVAVILGTILFILKIQLPYVINKPLSMLSALTSPLSMLVLGEKITKLKFKEIIGDKDIYYGCFVRLLVSPIISLAALKVVNAPELLTSIIVTMQSLPSAILLVVLTQKHDGEIELASKFTIISHIVSIATIPLISMFL
ncbi:AEC family transporter [Tissierella sp.]|uniref:AEC family transporter n=1 Tax=Tissierella sp. TaxID=41274 RepID=UPI0028AD4EE3|nr:AEC family transporter [Tissierella sp.]